MKAYVIAAAAVLTLAACARKDPGPAASPQAPAAQKVKAANGTEGEIVGTPAPGSKFSRIAIGMSMKQVTDLIGQPSDTGSHITGKSFIPFYFGGDTHRVNLFYKNEGELSFAPSHIGSITNLLVKIVVERGASGYAK